MALTLVLGGARSGKSAVAERLAGNGPVTYLATGTPTDDDMAARIAAHQRRRPPSWTTVEVGRGLVAALARVDGAVLVDSLGTWLSGHEGFAADVDALCGALAGRAGDSVVVTEEVGWGVHPSTALGRAFRDALGEANQRVAAVADEVLLVVAGRVLRLDPVQ